MMFSNDDCYEIDYDYNDDDDDHDDDDDNADDVDDDDTDGRHTNQENVQFLMMISFILGERYIYI